MSSKLEKLENNLAEITITIPAEEFNAALDESFKKNVKKITVRGFRKGKAPRKLIEKEYGEAIFYDDAIDALCPKYYAEAVSETKIEPVDRPSLEVKEIGKDKDLVLEVKVTVKPEIELGEYKGIKLDEIVNTVSDEDIDADLKNKQDRNSRLITVEDRAVKNGDIVKLDFEGFVDDVAFAGGKGENHELEIGSNSFIPGFEEQIIGQEIGKTFDVTVTFPEEYHSEELKGKPAVFKCMVNGIQYKELPELDDEFAKEVSEFDTLDELKADIRVQLEKDAEDRTKTEKENAAMDKIIEGVKIDLPDCMVESRIEALIRENDMRMQQQGMSFEQYLKYMGGTIEMFKEQMKPTAKRQVIGTLALEKIAAVENIEIPDDEFDAKLKEMAETYKMELDKLKEILRPEDMDEMKADMKISKAMEFVVENAKFTKAKKKAAKADDAEANEEKPKKKTTKKANSDEE